jgi:hypothetical protein
MSKEYKTILSCLQEVNHSRPYFVGIIGQRYGWHQEKDGLDDTLTKTFENAAAFYEYPYPWSPMLFARTFFIIIYFFYFKYLIF